ncbi:hypothetical protein ABT336_11755 [Micromonospora sp. NPDC000207]|uniref:hypothetical protein n=1 Tax=Micromonospora sp. NPDC000207 TaxID=3154246 RepID=UPI0033223F9D
MPVWEQESVIAAQERRRAEHAARQAAAVAKRVAARDELIAAFPDLAVLLTDRYADAGGFMWDMRDALRRGVMTPRQAEAAARGVQRDREQDAREAAREAEALAALAAGVEVPAGKLTFSGTVLTVRYQDGLYPGRGGHKMLLQHADGWKAWGSVPRSMDPEDTTSVGWDRWRKGLRGRVVTVTATVQPSQDDPLFGYFTRPRVVSVGEVPPVEVEPAPVTVASVSVEVAPVVVLPPPSRPVWPGQLAFF